MSKPRAQRTSEAASTMPSSSPSSTPTTFRGGGWILAAALVGFAVFMAWKMKAASANREAIAKQGASVVAAAVETAKKPPSVAVVRGQATSWRPQVTFEGSLKPAREADLGFKVGGRLATIKVKVGDKVRAGSVLATLDAREAEAQLKSATAGAHAADAQLALAEDGARRTAIVVASGAQTEASGVQAEKQKALAQAQRESALAQEDLARTTLASHVLVAPFPGTVARVPSGAGAVVGPGVPLFHVAELGSLKLVGSVSEADAPLVKVGSEVALPGRKARGKVVAVVASLDPSTKRVPLEASFENDGADPLLAGALVRASISGGTPVQVLRFPHEVLRPGSQDEVLVVNGDTLTLKKVVWTGNEQGDVLVRQGLGADDVLLAKPWAEAKTGDRVSVAAGAVGAAGAPAAGAGK